MEPPEELAVANIETAIASQSSHFLPNASGFQIVGGQFVLGNVNNHPPVLPVSPPRSAQALPSLSTDNLASSSSTAPILAESEIYCNRLLYHKRGFPLYVPEPHGNLPAEYQRSGVRIGDVGRVTPEGAFDFLFNIYHPSEHPININGVPEEFSPLPSYLAGDVVRLNYGPGDYVSTPTVQEADLDSPSTEFPGGEFVFRCKAPSGAVLALPTGSCLEKLENLERVRRYAAKNAESWYRHINAPEGRGRQLMNGFLYLITGCEKSQSWGSASFQNVAPDFQLSFKPNANTNTGYNYRWRRGTPARTKQFMNPTPDQENLTNQTLFLHGFSISLGEGLWGKLFGDVSVEQITDSYLKNPHSTSVPFSSRGSSAFGVFGFLRGNSSGGRDNIDHHADDEVNISEIAATPNVFHPSRIINSYLAEKVPLATVVLTHDDDWGQVLRADDKESPIRNPSEWVQRILTDFTVTEEDGTIYLIRNAVTEAITDDNSALARQIGWGAGFAISLFNLHDLAIVPQKAQGRSTMSDTLMTKEVTDFRVTIPSVGEEGRDGNAGIPHTTDSIRDRDPEEPPVKRGRGRPKGSKNKKVPPAPAAEASSSAPSRKRGRPPKEKKDEDGKEDESGDEHEPTPKRKRGRPPKAPAPADPEAQPKKRGRPPKEKKDEDGKEDESGDEEEPTPKRK